MKIIVHIISIWIWIIILYGKTVLTIVSTIKLMNLLKDFLINV